MTAAATTVEGAVEIQVAVSVLSPKRRAVWLKVSLLLLVRFRQFWEGKVNRRRIEINNNLVSHRLSRLSSNGIPRCIMEYRIHCPLRTAEGRERYQRAL